MINGLLERLGEASLLAPGVAFLVGAMLGLSPIAWPSVPAVVSFMSPGQVDSSGQRLALPLARAFPVVLAFVVGMNGVVSLIGYAFVEVTVALSRVSVVLHIVSAAVMGGVGLLLLTRRTSLCNRAYTLPPRPLQAFAFGIVFSVSGCPGCLSVSLGLGAASAVIGGLGYAVVIIGAFVLGQTAVLMTAAGVGSRLLPRGTKAIPWHRLDILVGLLFLAAAAYYVYRLVNGEVFTKLPGERGSGILP
ncbi:MAG: cytochrome c biogenesis protein CcdA [Actinomycetota bacterium]